MMFKKPLVSIAWLLVVFAVSFSCLGKYVIIYESAKGSTISLQTESMLIINLPANPSTGYSWNVVSMNRSVLSDVSGDGCIGCGQEYVFPAHIPGAPGTQILRFTGSGIGQTEIVAYYERSWESKRVAPLKTFTVTVTSKGVYRGTPRMHGVRKSYSQPPQSDIYAYGLPAHYNWDDSGWVTPVKNQGAAASCWAHGTVAVFEAKIKKKTGITKDLSEQYLCSCNPFGYSAGGGGWWAHPMFYMTIPSGENEAGAVLEADDPYMAADIPCGGPHAHYDQIEGWGYIDGKVDDPWPKLDHTSTTAEIKQAIYTYGPLGTDIDASKFGSYKGGVFTQATSTSTNHIVTITGWDDVKGCFYVKNSWGASWGEKGYIWIAYGCCQIGHNATYVNFEKTNPRMIFAGNTFNEIAQNNGRIANAVKMTLTDAKGGIFAMSSGTLTQGTHFTASNVPAGLTLAIKVLSNTTASISLTGTATAHAKSNSITNLTVTFLDAAFTNIKAADVEFAVNSAFNVKFFDPWQVRYQTFSNIVCDSVNNWKFCWVGPNSDLKVGLWYTGSNPAWPQDPEQHKFKLETYTRPALATGSTMPGDLIPLTKGIPINADSKTWCPGGSYGKQHTICGPTYTVWKGKSAYAGAQYTLNGFPIYIWFQLKVAADGRSVTLVDCAYNEDPMGYINSGEQTGVTAINETGLTESIKSSMALQAAFKGKNVVLNYNIPAATGAKIKILTLSGKVVKTIALEKNAVSSGKVLWNLETNSGSQATNGMYMIRMISGTSSTVTRIAVYR